MSTVVFAIFCLWHRGFAGTPANSATNVSIVDLLVLFTPTARTAAGGVENISAEIDFAVSEANMIFENSRARVRIRLVHAEEIAYAESLSLNLDMLRLQKPDDGFLDGARSLRNLYQADLVCLVTERSYDYWFYGLQGPSAQNPFSVILRRFLHGSYFFPVTLSFNFGCQLERPYADSEAAFPYSYGYSFIGLDGSLYSTADALSGFRLPWLSNPQLDLAGIPTGVPAGLPDAADNVRTINNTAPIVAAFRGGAPQTVPPLIRFTGPEPASQFARTSTVPLLVEAKDSDGSISRVIFVARDASGANVILLGTSTNAPFTFPMHGLDPGDWTIQAQAVDDLGATASAYLSLIITNVPPPNDNFADAIPLSGTNASIIGWTVGATLEPGETDWGGGSVWYSWTAPDNGRLRLYAPDWSYGTVFAVLTGSTVSTLNTIVNNGGSSSAIELDVFGGKTYYITVANSVPLSHFALEWTFHPAMVVALTTPANRQHFASPIAIPFSAEATTVPPAQLTHVDFFANEVIIGSSTAPPYEMLWTNAGPGEYVVNARAFDSAGTARDSATAQITVGPLNDDFVQRATLVGTNLSIPGTNRGATLEDNEPLHSDLEQAASVWWSWTAPASGHLVVSLTVPTIWTAIAIYTGSEMTNLTRLASTYQLLFTWPSVALDVQEGVTYSIAIAGVAGLRPGLEGDFTLNLQLEPPAANTPASPSLLQPYDPSISAIALLTTAPSPSLDPLLPPANDNFDQRATLLGTNTTSSIDSLLLATKEVDEPNHAGAVGRHSVWWTWTAPESRTMTLNVQTNGFVPILAVYTGDSLSNLVPIASVVATSLTFDAIEGTTYQIALDSDGDPTTDATAVLELFSTAPPPNNNFADRISLVGFHATASGTTAGADGVGGLGHSVWWTWTAPDSGTARLNVSPPSFSPALAVYTGETPQDLSPVASTIDTNLLFSVTEGKTYQLLVDVAYGSTGPFNLDLSIITPPTNDDFENRRPLMIVSNGVAWANPYATTQLNETLPPRASGHTVWWTWTAPTNETVYVSTVGSSFAPLVSVYLGDSITNLSLIGSNSYTRPPVPPHLQDVIIIIRPPIDPRPPRPPPPIGWAVTNNFWFIARAGMTYHFSVDGLNGAYGDIVLSLSSSPLLPPPNNNFADRVSLSGDLISLTTSNSFANKESGEPDHAGIAGGASVWYSWMAPADGRVRINTTGSSFPTLIGVYTGDVVSDLLTVAGGRVAIDFDATAGQTYQIAVDGENGTDGNISLSLKFYLPPPNDNFAAATELIGSSITTTGYNVGATIELNETTVGPTSIQHSVWWKWTAPSSGRANVSVAADFAPFTAVYSGGVLAQATPVVTGGSNLFFLAQSGAQYQIAVASTNESVGDIELGLSLVQPPANDLFANRIPLSGRDITISGSTMNATRERGESLLPGSLTGASVWYTWTAPSSGTVTLTLPDGTPGQSFAIFVGSKLSSLLRLGRAPNGTGYSLKFYACQGVTYQIQVSDDQGIEGDFALHVVASPVAPGLTSPTPQSLSAEGLALHVSGVNGQSFVLEASTDLNHWVMIGVDTIFGTSLDFVDVSSKTFPYRFYRVRPLEALFSSGVLSVAPANNADPGTFKVQINGRPGAPFALESSSDLKNWTELARGTIIGEATDFPDPIDSSRPYRFYRAVPLQ